MLVAPDYLEFADVRELTRMLGLANAGEIEGLCLAADIVNSSGGVLYKGGSPFGIRQERKLRSLHEEFGQRYAIRLERNAALNTFVAGLIAADFAKVEESIRGRKPFGESLEKIAPMAELFRELVAGHPDLALPLFTARELEKELIRESSPPLYHHALFRSVMLVALMEFVQEFTGHELDPEHDYPRALEGSLALHIGLQEEYQSILEADRRRRCRVYRAALADITPALHRMQLQSPVEAILEFVPKYYGGDAAVVVLSSESAMHANFIIGVDQFAVMANSYFEANLPMKEVFERILKLGIQGKLHPMVVEALAKGFPQMASFDFYSELERILGDCDSASGHPHPIHSLFSATLVLCSSRDTGCPHYSGAAGQPVYITQDDDSGLAAGSYGTCKLMTPQLTALYERYYNEIKAGVTADRNAGFKPG